MMEKSGEVEERHLSVGVVITSCALGLVGLMTSLAFFIFNVKLRNNRMIKMTSPNLNLVLAGGGILLSACCALQGTDYFLTESSGLADAVCQVRSSLLTCGFSLLYGPMLAKAWRVYRLFRDVGTRKVIIKDSQLLLVTGVLVLLDVLLLVVWQATDPLAYRAHLLFPQIEYDADQPSPLENLHPVRILGCSGKGAHSWLAGFLLLKMALLTYGLFLSWQTRAVALPSMNDSQCIVVSTVTTITMTTLTVSVSFLLHDQPNAVYTCVALSVWLCSTVATCMAFVPKIALWWRNPEGKGIRLSVSSSTCSACSVAGLHLQLGQHGNEELGHAAAENETLRKSLEERDASIRKLQEHLTSAHSKLSRLGITLDKQDSGLDADLSSTDSEDTCFHHKGKVTATFRTGHTKLEGLWRRRGRSSSREANDAHTDSSSSERPPTRQTAANNVRTAPDLLPQNNDASRADLNETRSTFNSFVSRVTQVNHSETASAVNSCIPTACSAQMNGGLNAPSTQLSEGCCENNRVNSDYRRFGNKEERLSSLSASQLYPEALYRQEEDKKNYFRTRNVISESDSSLCTDTDKARTAILNSIAKTGPKPVFADYYPSGRRQNNVMNSAGYRRQGDATDSGSFRHQNYVTTSAGHRRQNYVMDSTEGRRHSDLMGSAGERRFYAVTDSFCGRRQNKVTHSSVVDRRHTDSAAIHSQKNKMDFASSPRQSNVTHLVGGRRQSDVTGSTDGRQQNNVTDSGDRPQSEVTDYGFRSTRRGSGYAEQSSAPANSCRQSGNAATLRVKKRRRGSLQPTTDRSSALQGGAAQDVQQQRAVSTVRDVTAQPQKTLSPFPWKMDLLPFAAAHRENRSSRRRASDVVFSGYQRTCRSETNSDRSSKRRRHQKRRHSACLDSRQMASLRESIAQDLQNAQSLSNLLENSLSQDLLTAARKPLPRRSSCSEISREDLTQSIVGSYGLENTSDTHSFVSSLLPPCIFVQSPVCCSHEVQDSTSTLASDCLYPEKRLEEKLAYTYPDRGHSDTTNMSFGPGMTYGHTRLPPLTSHPLYERTDNSGGVYSIQLARSPEFHHSGYAQTRLLTTSDTFI